MIRASFLSLVCTIAIGLPVGRGQDNATLFRWQQGQVLTYRVEHVTYACETAENKKNETKTNLNLTKRWRILDVDAAGVATLELSLAALRLETTTPSGGVLLFDSANPEKSDAQMTEELKKFVGPILAVLRVDGRGKVVEVKQVKQGPASKFESEPPFILVFSDAGLQVGVSWERSYKITIDPPQGTGDKYDAVQECACKSVTQGTATVDLNTVLKSQPASLLDRVPLLQLQPQGEVVFDLQAGRLQSANLQVDKEITGHQGQGSSYRFQSTYKEEYRP
jgi:hypothetical protein